MGQSIHKSIKTLSHNHHRLIMAGQTGSGKTTIIDHLHLGAYLTSNNMENSMEQIQYNYLNLNIWSLDGQWKSMYYQQNYFDCNDAIIYVLDSLTEESITQARYTINKIYTQNKNKKTPVLIFANNKNNKMKPSEIKEKLDLESVILGVGSVHIQECNAMKGEGLTQGFEWLSSILKQNIIAH